MLDEELDEFFKSLDEEVDVRPQKQSPKPKPDQQLPDDLDDILNDPAFSTEERETKKPTKLKNSRSKKCTVVYVGQSESSMGQTSCPNMRCTKCDCGFICFNDFEWAGDIEYLFLRNNYPDFERLESKLKPIKGSSAYACQCNSVSVKRQGRINNVKNSLKWFCGSH